MPGPLPALREELTGLIAVRERETRNASVFGGIEDCGEEGARRRFVDLQGEVEGHVAPAFPTGSDRQDIATWVERVEVLEGDGSRGPVIRRLGTVLDRQADRLSTVRVVQDEWRPFGDLDEVHVDERLMRNEVLTLLRSVQLVPAPAIFEGACFLAVVGQRHRRVDRPGHEGQHGRLNVGPQSWTIAIPDGASCERQRAAEHRERHDAGEHALATSGRGRHPLATRALVDPRSGVRRRPDVSQSVQLALPAVHRSVLLAQELTQPRPRAVQVHAHRGARTPHAVRDLVGVQVADVAKDDRRALVRGEGAERLDQPVQLGRRDLPVRGCRETTLAADLVDRDAERDPVDPRERVAEPSPCATARANASAVASSAMSARPPVNANSVRKTPSPSARNRPSRSAAFASSSSITAIVVQG